MGRYRVTDPTSGRTLTLTGDSPPTEAELEEVFSKVNSAAPSEPSAPAKETSRIPGGASGMESMARAALPRSFNAAEEGAGFVRQAGAGALDALSAGGRAVAAATENPITPFAYAGAPYSPKLEGLGSFNPAGGRRFANSMADTDGGNLAGKVLRDPALLPSLATGGALGAAAKGLGLTGFGAASVAGGIAGAESAAIHQADNATQGRRVDLKSAALETATGAALPVVGAAVAGVAKWANKGLGKLAEGLSGVSEDALRIHGAGLGQGAKDLAAAAGKQREIGSKLVDALDNLDDYLPEKQAVDAILPNIPPVNVKNTVASLQAAKTGGALKSSRDVNAKIEEVIADLTGAADEAGHIPAVQFREIRKEIDGLIGDAFGKESNKYVSALKSARHQMADDLVGAAKASGNPQYAEAMKTMADKLKKADKLSQFLGKNSATRENRAESFISTLFGKNKAERREAVQAMGEIFGDDFLAQAKMSNLAAELGDEGKAGLLPRQWTGRAALGPGLAALGGTFVNPAAGAIPLALSSPRLAGAALAGSGFTASQLARPGVQAGASALGRYGLRPYFRGLGEDQNP